MRIRWLVLVAGLALAAPVPAQDQCLTGASLLPDQRALGALRAATDTACPCHVFSTASSFRSCAGHVVRGALEAGALRPECKRTAKDIYLEASCGTQKAPCGRYTPLAANPLSCRPKPVSRCIDRRRSQSEACTAQTYCADVVDWTASTCVDVREGGPFVPGVRVVR